MTPPCLPKSSHGKICNCSKTSCHLRCSLWSSIQISVPNTALTFHTGPLFSPAWLGLEIVFNLVWLDKFGTNEQPEWWKVVLTSSEWIQTGFSCAILIRMTVQNLQAQSNTETQSILQAIILFAHYRKKTHLTMLHAGPGWSLLGCFAVFPTMECSVSSSADWETKRSHVPLDLWILSVTQAPQLKLVEWIPFSDLEAMNWKYFFVTPERNLSVHSMVRMRERNVWHTPSLDRN